MTRRNAASGYLPQRLDILDDALTVPWTTCGVVAPRASVNEVRAGLARFLFRGARADQVAGSAVGRRTVPRGPRGAAARGPAAATAAARRADQQPRPRLGHGSCPRRCPATAARCWWSATTSRSCGRSGSPAGCASTAQAASRTPEPAGRRGVSCLSWRRGVIRRSPDIGDRLPVWLGWACRQWTNGRSSPTSRGWRASRGAGPSGPRAVRNSRCAGCCSSTSGRMRPRCPPSPTHVRWVRAGQRAGGRGGVAGRPTPTELRGDRHHRGGA